MRAKLELFLKKIISILFNYRKIRLQDLNPGIQLRISRESNCTSFDIVADRCLWYSERRSLLLSRHDTRLSVLRVTAALLPQRFCLEAIRLGMATLAFVTDVDNSSHMDPEVRETRSHREALRCTYVRLPAHRSVDGSQSEERRSAGS